MVAPLFKAGETPKPPLSTLYILGTFLQLFDAEVVKIQQSVAFDLDFLIKKWLRAFHSARELGIATTTAQSLRRRRSGTANMQCRQLIHNSPAIVAII